MLPGEERDDTMCAAVPAFDWFSILGWNLRATG
jgi:hypothetical protein